MAEKQDKRAPDDEVPAGFDVRVGRERGDGWLAKTPGQVITGRLLGRFRMKGQMNDDGTERVFYQIKLGKGCSYGAGGDSKPGVRANQTDENKEKHEVILQEGQILNVDEHKALEEMSPFTRDGGIYDVWFKYVRESPIPGKGNRTFWEVKGPMLKTIQPAKHAPRADVVAPAKSSQATEVAEDDIPF